MKSKILNITKKYQEFFKTISTIISWTIFVLLLICAFFLIYYYISLQVYKIKGVGYEPKFSLYTIVSPSMVPNINVYDVVVDTKVRKPEDIKINDVITYNSSLPGIAGGTITHRVIAINKDANGNYYYQTRGDNNLVADSAKVRYRDIVGKVYLRIPKLGKVQSLVATKGGWLILILIPALYIVVSGVFKAFQQNMKDGKLKKIMSKPLLSYKKPKLLPYTPQEDKIESVEINLGFSQTFMDSDDDFDINDLPKLK